MGWVDIVMRIRNCRPIRLQLVRINLMNLRLVFVLVGTTHTGNIGATARAMKNMGFAELRLVDCCPHLTKEALSRSSGADGVLREAKCYDTLDEAVADCQHVIGTSARDRHVALPVKSCRDVATQIAEDARSPVPNACTAMVFGQERAGLTNEQMDRCTCLLRIPVNPDFSSLNLGAAVQVVAYECAQALQIVSLNPTSEHQSAIEPAASGEDMQHLYDHLQTVMVDTGFMDPDNPKLLMRRIRRYFERNRPSDRELAIFRGILSATQEPIRKKKRQSSPD